MVCRIREASFEETISTISRRTNFDGGGNAGADFFINGNIDPFGNFKSYNESVCYGVLKFHPVFPAIDFNRETRAIRDCNGTCTFKYFVLYGSSSRGIGINFTTFHRKNAAIYLKPQSGRTITLCISRNGRRPCQCDRKLPLFPTRT